VLLPLIRWAAWAAFVLLIVLLLGSIALLLLPGLLPPGLVPRSWTEMLEGPGWGGPVPALLGVTLAAGVVLAGLRLLDRRIGSARRARYHAQARERKETGRQRATPVAPPPARRTSGIEAILLIDLIQSTELLATHGDVFFRDLLRRVGAAFVPIAREHETRYVDGHGDGLLFCFDRPDQALEAARAMYARLPAIQRDMPLGVEVAFRASLHVGETVTDKRGNRTGLAVVKTVRLGSVMANLHGRGAGRNTLVVSAEALPALVAAGAAVTPLGDVDLRDVPGRHPVYQVEI